MNGELRLTVGEVAAMVGLSPYTLRAWERRHQVLSPLRTTSGHRRYTADDVDLLRRVKHNVSMRGMSVKVAVAEAKGLTDAGESPPDSAAPEPVATEPTAWRAVADLLPQLILLLDMRGRIIDANLASARAAGVLRPHLRGTRFTDLVDPYDRAKAVRIYRRPEQRRNWELNMRTRMLTTLISFDCRPVRVGEERIMVLVGQDLSSSGLELWGAEASGALERSGRG